MAAALDPSLLRLPPLQPGMRIGLLGGSFDPAHAGHRAISLVALRSLNLDEVWWLVSPRNPLKPHAPSADLLRRIRQARKVANHPRIKVTGVEAALGTRYTADTLQKLAPRMAGAQAVWLMGADSLADFHRWDRWRSIAASIPMAVFNRPGYALRALGSPAAHALAHGRMPEWAAASLPGTAPPAWVFLARPLIALSSTAIRTASRTKAAS
ncbi:MAG: nicotinate-nucleotide adenylyltransferase [Bauldia sp.]